MNKLPEGKPLPPNGHHIIELRYNDPVQCGPQIRRTWISFKEFQSLNLLASRYPSFVVNHQRELFFGLIRIHVLVHALHEPIFGLAMMQELEHHGYHIGPGTLYPLLHGLERGGLLRSQLKNVGGRRRRVYAITAIGKRALEKARLKVDELHHELHEGRPRKIF